MQKSYLVRRCSSVGIATRYGLVGSEIESSRFQWPSGVRRRSAAARLLDLPVRIPPEPCMFVLCVLSIETAKRRTIKTQKHVCIEYRVQENTKKSSWGRDFSHPVRPARS